MLITFFKKLFRIFLIPKLILAVYRLEKTRNYIAKNQILEAQRIFSKGEKMLVKLPYEYKILKGKVMYFSRERESCIELFKEAWNELESDQKILPEDKKYYKSYISSIFNIYKEYITFDEGDVKFINIQTIDLSKVSKSLMRDFPMRNHPDWDKYNK
jgi:hypothetical protein